MKKFAFVLTIILLLAACSTPTITEEPMSVTYTAYLSETNSDYVGVYESNGSVVNSSYGYVGNNSSGAAFWLMFKLPSNFPFEGVMMGDYESQAAKVTGAILRLPEVNEGTRGSNTLTMKVSPITGAWNASANWGTVPTYKSSVVDTYSSFAAVPSSSNYDYRTGYHSATYTYKYYNRLNSSAQWVLQTTSSISYSQYQDYYNNWGGTNKYITDANGRQFWYSISSTSSYYDTYIVYHDINLTNVIKDCIDNGATGLILYFDTSNSTYNRKVFETILNSSVDRQPKIVINFEDAAGDPPIKITSVAGGISKQITSGKIFTGAAFKEITGAKVYTGSGFKTVF